MFSEPVSSSNGTIGRPRLVIFKTSLQMQQTYYVYSISIGRFLFCRCYVTCIVLLMWITWSYYLYIVTRPERVRSLVNITWK